MEGRGRNRRTRGRNKMRGLLKIKAKSMRWSVLIIIGKEFRLLFSFAASISQQGIRVISDELTR